MNHTNTKTIDSSRNIITPTVISDPSSIDNTIDECKSCELGNPPLKNPQAIISQFILRPISTPDEWSDVIEMLRSKPSLIGDDTYCDSECECDDDESDVNSKDETMIENNSKDETMIENNSDDFEKNKCFKTTETLISTENINKNKENLKETKDNVIPFSELPSDEDEDDSDYFTDSENDVSSDDNDSNNEIMLEKTNFEVKKTKRKFTEEENLSKKIKK